MSNVNVNGQSVAQWFVSFLWIGHFLNNSKCEPGFLLKYLLNSLEFWQIPFITQPMERPVLGSSFNKHIKSLQNRHETKYIKDRIALRLNDGWIAKVDWHLEC